VITGKLTELTSSVATYLFRIGRNKAFEYHRAMQKKQEGRLEDTLQYHLADENGMEKQEVEENYRVMDAGMQELGEPCRSIIHNFYVLRQTMEELAERMDYKNADTVKNLKYKCLKRLQKICETLKAKNTVR
jgi:RNA polymerase sigma factor (sigma-70 family)